MKYEVKKPFPSKEKLLRGQVVENPTWKNLNSLVRTGYLREIEEIPEITEEKISEVKPKRRKKNVTD